MKYFSSALRSGLAAAALVLLPITEVAAQLGDVWPANVTTERSCTFPLQGNSSVTIIAGQNGNPAAPFPIPVTSNTDGLCPSGTCLRWDYLWQYNGVNPSLALVAVDSNVRVKSAPDANAIIAPGAFDSSLPYGNVGSEVGIRYTTNSATYYGRFYTDASAVVGTVTAGFKSGGRSGFCGIAGATKMASANSDLSIPKELVTTSLGCTVKWAQSADGCVTGVAITGQTTVPGKICSVTPSANGSGKPSLQALHNASNTASCGTEINAPGSTNICRYNSFLRTYTCVTVDP